MTDVIDLTGLWRFQPDPYDEGEAASFFAPGHDARRWWEVAVPCTFDRCGPGMAAYEGAGWFRREVVVPESWRGRPIALSFGAVNYQAAVWVNGQPVGGSEDGFLPFALPIEAHVRFGEANVITVRADNTRLPGDVPGRDRGWRPYGGILREVALIARAPVHLASPVIDAGPDGRFALTVQAVNGGTQDTTAALSVAILRDGDIVATCSAPPVAVAAGETAEIRCDGTATGIEPWSPERPVCYTARLTLHADAAEADRHALRFGFRRIEARGTQLLLNGEPLVLLGCNRHEDSPRTDAAVDLAQARADFLAMKELGANFVRLCHYPHHPGELDLCDELGLLAMCEIPLYWWHGLEEGEAAHTAKLSAARRQTAALIARDRHHPSVIFWSVGNETQEDRPEVAAGMAELVALAKSLDPTRLAVHVSDHWVDHPNFDADDVICVNAYPSLSGRRQVDAGQWWAKHLAALHARCPDKPILVAEFGGVALEETAGTLVGEDTQAAVLEHEFAGMTAPYLCGATVWCYADHPWPEEPFLRNLTTSPYGLVTRSRRRKPAFATVQALFHGRRGLAPAAPPAPNPRNLPVGMIRPHLRDIPQFAFPEGYRIRPLRPGDGALWTDIQRDAETWFEIGDELFAAQFGFDLEATTWRSFFVVNDRNVAVGAISAWYDRDLQDQDFGRIHWVALRPACQGKGLAKPMMTHAMNCLAQWHERAYLDTSTGRIPAIKIYLDFGFLPDLSRPGALEAWRQVREALDHPALAMLEDAEV